MNLQTISAKLDHTEIVAGVEKFVLQNFRKIRHSEAFLEMPLDYQMKILDSSDLKVDKETNVLETAMEISKRNPKSQLQLNQLLSCIWLETLENDELTEITLDYDGIFRESQECIGQIRDALKWKLDRVKGKGGSSEESMEKDVKRPWKCFSGQLMVAGGAKHSNDGELRLWVVSHFCFTLFMHL